MRNKRYLQESKGSLHRKETGKPCMVAQTYGPSTEDGEVGGASSTERQGQPWLPGEPCLQNK